MAIDNTPPRLRLIATIGVIVLITLVGLDFVFKSYFAFMTDEAKREKSAARTGLLSQVGNERQAFAGAKLPIDQAMGEVAKGIRPDLIDPKPSEDLGAMTGWSKMPKAAPIVMPAAPVDAGASAMDGDASTASTDAGAADAAAAAHDAGPVKPGPATHH